MLNATSSRSLKPAKILIVGIGDLGSNIARLIVEGGYSSACLLAGQSGAAAQWAQLLQICTGRDVRAAHVDGLDAETLKTLFTAFEPDLIVQCATLLSPFRLKEIGTPAAMAILKGGFALQTAAQLPVIRAVMRARQSLGMTCPVINCSYPDVTNPILACEGLAPTCGIGNVANVALRFRQFLPGAVNGDLRVIGHHSQLGYSLAGEPADITTPVPLVYLDGRKLEARELLLKPGLQGGRTQNYLAAATIRPILEGLLDPECAMETHAPGIDSLPGGYPVRFSGQKISLNLPESLSREEAIAFNTLSAAGDGVDHIAEDGTLFYTAKAKEAVAPYCHELAEPLHPEDLNRRLRVLQTACQS
ncbi:MAG: hypothetical protein WA708_13265 [Acidobacteriaceae bacterium]|jgi:hypothetical protein